MVRFKGEGKGEHFFGTRKLLSGQPHVCRTKIFKIFLKKKKKKTFSRQRMNFRVSKNVRFYIKRDYVVHRLLVRLQERAVPFSNVDCLMFMT